MLCSCFQTCCLPFSTLCFHREAPTGVPSTHCQLGLGNGSEGVLLEGRGQELRGQRSCYFCSRTEGPPSLTNSAACSEPLPCTCWGLIGALRASLTLLVFLFPTQTFADRPFIKPSSEYPNCRVLFVACWELHLKLFIFWNVGVWV